MSVAAPRRKRAIAGLELLGGVLRFGAAAVRRIPRARHHAGDVLHEIATLVTGTTLVVLAGCVMVGQSCGLESAYVARATSTPTLAPSATFGCAVVYVVPFFFGFILAAKVGCGFVAELGAMRVNDEVDALEVMGIDSITYLVSTRLLASTLVMPIIYTLAIGPPTSAASCSRACASTTPRPGPTRPSATRSTARPTSSFARPGPDHLYRRDHRGAVLRLPGARRSGRGRNGHGAIDGGQPDRDHLGEPRVHRPVPAQATAADRVRRVGAALVVVVVIVAFVLTRHDSSYTVTAVFDQAQGLVKGGRVLAAGRPVGSVERITLGKSDGLPHVVLRIDGDYRLHRGATADLRLASNSGELNRVVALTAGSGPPLASGATLPRSRTDQPVEIDEVLGTLDPRTRADVRAVFASMDGATRGLDGAFARSLRHSGDALHETASLLGALDSDGHSLRTLVAKGRSAADAFAAQRAALGTTVSGLSAVLQTTAHRQREIDSSIRQLPATLATLRATLDDTRATVPDLRRLVVAGAPAARMLRHVAPQLSRTLVIATPTLQELATTVRRAPPQLDALVPLLRVARPVVKQLTPVLRGACPCSTCCASTPPSWGASSATGPESARPTTPQGTPCGWAPPPPRHRTPRSARTPARPGTCRAPTSARPAPSPARPGEASRTRSCPRSRLDDARQGRPRRIPVPRDHGRRPVRVVPARSAVGRRDLLRGVPGRRQLVPGHDVVEGGTRVGIVDKVKLTDRGTVLVTATLDRGVPRPRQDAAASVRVADLLGNVYLSLSPGHASAPLTRAIALSRTFVATQLQDLLNSFAEPTRSALQAILVELGTTLDARGDDLNGAVLRLAPLLDEITRVSNQVGSQNAQLGRLVSSGAALAAQIAPRSRDLERLINGLDWTTSITSARAASLDRGIARLPRTLRQTRRTLARVQQVAVAATPLAGDLAATAPQLTSAVVQLRPFTRTAAPALARLGLLTRNLTATLSRGGRSLARLRRSFAALAGTRAPGPRSGRRAGPAGALRHQGRARRTRRTRGRAL